MSVYQVANGRWVAHLIARPNRTHLGTFDTREMAQAAKDAALAALPPKPPAPYYIEEDRGYETPCWIWQRAKATNGYGRLCLREGDRRWWTSAHRYYYEKRHGPVSKALHLDHLCRVRACCNPDHLEPVTHAENCRRGANTKLTPSQVASIRRSDEPTASLARRFRISETTIYNVRHGHSWGPDKRTQDLAEREAA